MESALAPKADEAHRTTRIASVRVVKERENIFRVFGGYRRLCGVCGRFFVVSRSLAIATPSVCWVVWIKKGRRFLLYTVISQYLDTLRIKG